jgi:hypothetical protein
MSEPVVVRIIGLVSGRPTPMDLRWVVDYDPTRPGYDPAGNPMLCHLVTTADVREARRFSRADAIACIRQADGLRPDGKPNRPISAFTLEIHPADEPSAWDAAALAALRRGGL